MKNIKWLPFTFFYIVLFTVCSNASVIIPTNIITPNETWKNLKASEFVKLSINDFSKITGKKMNLKDKISFIVLNKRMKHALKKNPDLTVDEYLASNKKLGTGWWILIGAVAGAAILLIIAAISFKSSGW